jgi:hypothetical protein
VYVDGQLVLYKDDTKLVAFFKKYG